MPLFAELRFELGGAGEPLRDSGPVALFTCICEEESEIGRWSEKEVRGVEAGRKLVR